MMGYDTLFFNGSDDSGMIAAALSENRVILTRDSGILQRRLVTSGKLKAVLLTSDKPVLQMKQVIGDLNLDVYFNPFSICLECNRLLEERSKEQIKGRVPVYVFKTQNQFMECPDCHRIYWRGNHWREMKKKIAVFLEG